MDDLISRQAAIDALADYIHNVDKVYSTGHLSMSDCEDAARSVIDDLSSAQPDNSCDGCKYENAEDGVLVPCGFCKRSHPDNYERRTDEPD